AQSAAGNADLMGGPKMKPEISTVHIFSANLGRWLGPQLPDEVTQAARAFLTENALRGRLRGAWVAAFGDDLHCHLTTYSGDFAAGEDPATVALDLAREAALAALSKGVALGFGGTHPHVNPSQLAGLRQEAALGLRRLEYSYTER